MSDPRPIGVFDSGVGGLTVLREIVRRLPGESTIYLGDNARAPYGVRSDDEVRAFSTRVARRARRARRQGGRRRLQHVDGRRPAATSGALRPPDPGRDPARRGRGRRLATRNRRVGVIATPATVRSHAYFTAIKDENPAIEVYEHATPALVPMVEAGQLTGPAVEARSAEALAPLLGERDAAGEFVFPLPPSARIDTLLLGCTHYPLLLPVIAAAAGERVAIVDSATATASALAELLIVNGLEAPARRGRLPTPRPAHDRRRRAFRRVHRR